MKTKRVSAYQIEHHVYNPVFDKVMSWKQFGLILEGSPFKYIPIILN